MDSCQSIDLFSRLTKTSLLKNSPLQLSHLNFGAGSLLKRFALAKEVHSSSELDPKLIANNVLPTPDDSAATRR